MMGRNSSTWSGLLPGATQATTSVPAVRALAPKVAVQLRQRCVPHGSPLMS